SRPWHPPLRSTNRDRSPDFAPAGLQAQPGQAVARRPKSRPIEPVRRVVLLVAALARSPAALSFPPWSTNRAAGRLLWGREKWTGVVYAKKTTPGPLSG